MGGVRDGGGIGMTDNLPEESEALRHDIERYIAIASQQAGRIVELEDAMRWRDISEVPCPPCAAELFWSNWPFRDGDEPYQDSRRQLGYWSLDDRFWRDMWTREVYDTHDCVWRPTHWRPLPPPPETTDDR